MGAKVGEYRDVPGPQGTEQLEKARKFLSTTTVQSLIVADRFEGPLVIDPDGNEFLDFTSGVGVNSWGGGSSLQFLWQALDELRYVRGACGDIGTDWYNTVEIAAAEYLASVIPLRDERRKVDLVPIGGKAANEAGLELLWNVAARLARRDRKTVVCFDAGFHGRGPCLGKLLDKRKPVRTRDYPQADFPVISVPFPDASLRNPLGAMQDAWKMISKDEKNRVAAVIGEPIQIEGGVRMPDQKAFQWFIQAWQEIKVPFIADEIQAGLGRTGMLLGCQNFGIKPDIITLAKHWGGGVPVGAVVFPAHFDWEELGRHSSSYGGAPIVARALHATVKHALEDGVMERNKQMGELLRKLLDAEIGVLPGVVEVRGVGLLYGIEFDNVELLSKVIFHAERLGLRVIGAGFQENPTLRVMPTFACDEEDIRLGVDILRMVIQDAING